MIDALKELRRENTAVIPYAYARQDRKSKPREPITAKLVADFQLLQVLTEYDMDLHAPERFLQYSGQSICYAYY